MTGPVRQRNRRGEGGRLREELVAAAGRLLDETGSEDALSVRAVTRAVGAAPQSAYLYFPDKSALLFAVYQDRYTDLAAAMGAAADRAGTAGGRLRALCAAYVDWALAHPGQFRSMHTAVGTAPPDWAGDRLPADEVVGLVTRAVAGTGAADPPRTALLLLAALNGVLLVRLNRPLFPLPAPVHDLADDLVTRIAAPA